VCCSGDEKIVNRVITFLQYVCYRVLQCVMQYLLQYVLQYVLHCLLLWRRENG